MHTPPDTSLCLLVLNKVNPYIQPHSPYIADYRIFFLSSMNFFKYSPFSFEASTSFSSSKTWIVAQAALRAYWIANSREKVCRRTYGFDNLFPCNNCARRHTRCDSFPLVPLCRVPHRNSQWQTIFLLCQNPAVPHRRQIVFHFLCISHIISGYISLAEYYSAVTCYRFHDYCSYLLCRRYVRNFSLELIQSILSTPRFSLFATFASAAVRIIYMVYVRN